VPEDQTHHLPTAGVEAHLHQVLRPALEVDEVLGTAQHPPFLQVNEENAQEGRAAGNGEVASVERELELEDVEGADAVDLEVAGGLVEEEIEVGVAAVVGENCHGPLVEGGEGLVGPAFGVAAWGIGYCRASDLAVRRSRR
jgi:hypothetical protein